MDANIWTLLGVVIILIGLMVLQQMQISSLKRGMENFFRWRERGLLVGWRDKEMQGGSSAVGIEEAIGLILCHLNLQIRKEKKEEIVIEKVPQPTKAQQEAMKERHRGIAGMSAQQSSYAFYSPRQRGGLFG